MENEDQIHDPEHHARVRRAMEHAHDVAKMAMHAALSPDPEMGPTVLAELCATLLAASYGAEVEMSKLDDCSPDRPERWASAFLMRTSEMCENSGLKVSMSLNRREEP